MFTIERIDADSREICRLFAENDRDAILTILSPLPNFECALVIAMATSKMAPSIRESFTDFLFHLCQLLYCS